jgi:hypothetical protein
MLYYLFTDWPDLLSVDGQAYGSYINIFQAYKHLYTHPQDFYTTPDADCSDLDKSNEDEPEPEDNHLLADFELLARRRPHEDFTRVESLEGLGDREVDRQYD